MYLAWGNVNKEQKHSLKGAREKGRELTYLGMDFAGGERGGEGGGRTQYNLNLRSSSHLMVAIDNYRTPYKLF